jgi:biopolymer transport protein ExbD/biopolymer transport protein TolR
MTRTAWHPRRVTAVEPEINVTPLVDVVLVLLIIFMVVAPRMEQDIPVNLPGIYNPDPDAEVSSPPVMVTVKDAGVFFIEGQQYDLESAVAQRRAEHSADPSRRLELRADAKLKYKDVRELYGRVQQVGFPGMSLLVSHRYQAGTETGTGTGTETGTEIESETGIETGDGTEMGIATGDGAALSTLPGADPSVQGD